MYIVGLTGGIGTGKTTVAQLFAAYGIPVIDADEIAHRLTAVNSHALQAIVQFFGKEVLNEDGSLNRALLREIIFKNKGKRQWLEHLLHPMIRKIIVEEVEQIHAPYVIAVIPLLLEKDFFSFINRILVVDAPYELQVERAVKRDGSNKATVEAMIKAQIQREERIARAHDVIYNHGSFELLSQEVARLHQEYLKLSAK